MQKRTKSIQESYAGITNLVQENLSGIRIVKSYTRELFEISRFEKLNQQYYTKNLSLGKLQALFFCFSHCPDRFLPSPGGMDRRHKCD